MYTNIPYHAILHHTQIYHATLGYISGALPVAHRPQVSYLLDLPAALALVVHMYVCIYIYIYIHIHICVYIYIEREREIDIS